MSWSAALNVTLGLVLAYFVFSVAASRINEFVATRLQWRSKNLENALYALLDGEKASPKSGGVEADRTPVQPALSPSPQLSAKAVKEHPEVAALDSLAGKNRGISYLPARTFSAAVLDILAPSAVIILDSISDDDVPDAGKPALSELREHPDAAHLAAFEQTLPDKSPLRDDPLPQLRRAIAGDVLQQARVAVQGLPQNNPARRTLLRMLADAGTDRDAFRSKLEHWYDDAMDRLSGWYKRRVHLWILGYGIALTVLFNVDTINVAQTLWRAPVEQAAAAQAAANAAGHDVSAVDTSVSALRGLALPLGWTPAHSGPKRVSTDPRHIPATGGQWLLKLLGLAITVGALSFGAPFWFDVLGKIARMRNTGNPPPKTD
jgi:hypothetical protein